MVSTIRLFMVPLFLFTTGAVALAACSNSTSGSGAPASATVTQHISAAAGGTVADTAGTATLSIPGGALAGDTDITLATEPAESGTATSVYDFGPTGTKFATPATLVLKLPASAAVPSGMQPMLATYDGTKWAPIAGSTFAGGAVTGPVAHFSKFTIVFVNGQATVSNSCSDTVTSFVACGGDLTGTWSLVDWCSSNGSIGTDPTDGGCPGFLATADVTPTGSITFNADGTYDKGAFDLAVKLNETIPTSCLGSTPCNPSSVGFGKNATNVACSTTGANCVCTGDQTSTDAAKKGTWTASGTTFATDSDTPQPYCVKNGTLYVQVDDSSGKLQFVIVATKQ